MIAAAEALAPAVGLSPACQALQVPRSTVYRHRQPQPEPAPRPQPARALSTQERQTVLDVLHSDDHADQAPAQVYHQLLDAGLYLCSIRTMYRVLAANAEVRERRNVLRHPSYQRPELLATGPNQVWSWDITKLPGPAKWTYFHLYVLLDIFSRYVVGWLLAERENARLAQRLISESCRKQNIARGQITIHADRGAPMIAKGTRQLLAGLGIYESHSRPRVSDDNPFSEAQFRTLKYHPNFPRRFGSLQDAEAFCRRFFAWYNAQHHHSGLAYLTPDDVHHGRAQEVLQRRQRVLDLAHRQRPERFVADSPRVPQLPSAVWINPPQEGGQTIAVAQ